MLHQINSFVVGELGIQFYGRYMDDFFLIHHDKKYLKSCLSAIRLMLGSLGLDANGKTQIVPFHKGIRFLGFHHYMTNQGKYIRKLSGENKQKMRRKVRKWSSAVKKGKMSKQKFDEKYLAWKNHASHGNCIKLCRSMDKCIDELLGD